MDTSLVSSFCDEDKFNNAYYLLKKTVDFLTSEYDMHFVILSAYQSSKSESVSAAYSSPGPAAKFFDEKYVNQSSNNNKIEDVETKTPCGSKNAASGLIENWDKFAKNYCFREAGHVFSNVPAYSEFIKSDLNDNSLDSGANCSTTIPDEIEEMPEPPSNIMSQTMYFRNGEFKCEDEDSGHSDGSVSGDEDTKTKICGVQRTQGLKRKSLQDVSDQLAKKAVAVNLYRPIYPAAPKIVTPTFAGTEQLLNLSNALMRANGAQSNSEIDFSSIKPLLNSVQNIFTQSAAASAYAALAQQQKNGSLFTSNIKTELSSVPSSVITPNTKKVLSEKPSDDRESLNNASKSSEPSSPLVVNIDSKPAKVPSTTKGKGSDSAKKSNYRSPPSPMKVSNLNPNGTPKQMWPCTVCSKEFASQSTMKRHLNHFHLKVHSYTCTYCQEVFYRKDKLVAHIKIKHGIDTSRSARLVTQSKTSPNGSLTTNSTISPESPACSESPNSSTSGGQGSSVGTASIGSPVPSPSPGTCIVQPMTPPSVSPSPTASPLSLTTSTTAVAAV
ncbi:uncharacterized protein LOC142339246 [Convolutriloba macropyga]|uniref:uncharacterized protein LOC142339246 n=1 Tax=Convolutriloba macropyga TaxID=536237 RepID=UPI003F528263